MADTNEKLKTLHDRIIAGDKARSLSFGNCYARIPALWIIGHGSLGRAAGAISGMMKDVASWRAAVVHGRTKRHAGSSALDHWPD